MSTNLTKSLQILADKVIYSETTLSEYYNIGCIKVRVSDHMACNMDCDLAIFAARGNDRHYVYSVIPMVGTFKEVQWFTNVEAVISFILKFESIARLLIKSPTSNDNQAERQQLNAETFEKEQERKAIGPKMNFNEWKGKLLESYACKKQGLDSLLNEIYQYDGSEETMARILKFQSVKAEVRKEYLMTLLNTIKH